MNEWKEWDKILVPAIEEIRMINYLQHNKSLGLNSVIAENIKYCETIMKQNIYEIIKDIWKQEVKPHTLNKTIIVYQEI